MLVLMSKGTTNDYNCMTVVQCKRVRTGGDIFANVALRLKIMKERNSRNV